MGRQLARLLLLVVAASLAVDLPLLPLLAAQERPGVATAQQSAGASPGGAVGPPGQGSGGSAAPLRIGRRAITILAAEPESRTLAIFERVEVVNEGEAAFTPSVGGGQGPMGLLRFALPRNAFDLAPDPQLAAHDIIQVDRGFGSLMPLAPGTTDVTFGYRVPYAGSQYELNTSAVYPTTSLLVLVPADLAVDSADLRLERVADIGRLRYQVLVAEGLAAGQRVAVTLGGLPFTPRPWLLDETVQRGAALALALLGVLGAWVYARRRGHALAPAPRGRLAGLEDAP